MHISQKIKKQKYDPNTKIILTLLLLVSILTSCSLIKIEAEEIPFTNRELNTRVVTRDFGERFEFEIIQAADSIIVSSKNLNLEINALRWKINSLVAVRYTIYQTNPTQALVDTWVFTAQMHDFFLYGQGKDLFGEYQNLVTSTSERLLKDIRKVAKSVSTSDEFTNYSNFVTSYKNERPIADLSFLRESSVQKYAEAVGLQDSSRVSTMGSTSEAIADFSERLSILSRQMPKQIGWQAQLISKNAIADSMSIISTLDSLAVLVNRISLVAERSPELLNKSLKILRQDIEPLLNDFDEKWTLTLDTLASERQALTESLHLERKAIMNDLGEISDKIVNQSLIHIREIVNDLLIYVILALLIIFGLPFTLGFLTGRIFTRRKKDG